MNYGIFSGFSIFRCGNVQSTIPKSMTASNCESIRVFNDNSAGGPGAGPLKALLALVGGFGAWRRALAVPFLWVLAVVPHAAAQTPLVKYTLDTISGTTVVNDITPGTYNGTGANMTYTAGFNNNAGTFNGSSSNVSCTTIPNMAQWTTAFWVKVNNLTAGQTWNTLWADSAWWNNGIAATPSIFVNSNQTLQVSENGWADWFPGFSFAGKYGTWIHITYSCDKTLSDGKNTKIYINGSLLASSSMGQNRDGHFGNFMMGYSFGARQLTGQIDDFRIYNTALTAAQVATVYGEFLPKIRGQVTDAGLIAISGATVSYKLSSGSTWSTVTADSGGNYAIGVPANTGPYDVKAGATGYVESNNCSPAPAVTTSDVTGINFALAGAYTITGGVTAYSLAQSGATVKAYTGAGATGTLAGTATTDSGGNYTINLAGTATYYVHAELAGFQNSSETTVSTEPATGVNFTLTAVPQVWYHLDETSGTAAADASGFSRNGTLTGTSAWLPGYIGTGCWADTGAGSVTVPSLGSSGQFTFATWIDVTSLPAGPGWNGVSIVSADGWSSGTVAWLLRESGQLQCSFNGVADMYATGFTFTGSNLNKWVHLALVYDNVAGTEKLYINGTLNNSISFSGAPAAVLTNLRAGSWNGSSRFINARFDDIRIYTAPLPASEIFNIYNDGVANANPDISGTVTCSDATSATGLTVTFTPAVGSPVSVTTNSGGTYSATLLPGTYTVSASKVGYDTATSDPVAVPPSVAGVNLVLNPTGYPVTITVTDGTNPVAGATVTVNGYPVIDNGNGTYSVASAINGTYAVTVAKIRYAGASDSVTVSGAAASKTLTLTPALSPVVDLDPGGLTATEWINNGTLGGSFIPFNGSTMPVAGVHLHGVDPYAGASFNNANWLKLYKNGNPVDAATATTYLCGNATTNPQYTAVFWAYQDSVSGVSLGTVGANYKQIFNYGGGWAIEQWDSIGCFNYGWNTSGAWHQIVITNTGTTQLMLVDGTLVYTYNHRTGDFLNDYAGNNGITPIAVGSSLTAAGNHDRTFAGLIGRFQLYEYGMTQAEAQALHTSVLPAAATNAHIITATAGTNGTISPAGPIAVLDGASQTYAITPADTYGVSSVLVDGSPVGAVTQYTFTNVTADHSISANFAIANPFLAWISAFDWSAFTNPDLSVTGDPDQDGMNNQTEYAFGLNPTNASSANPITASLDGSGQFTYQRNATSGLTYTVWTSTDLQTWTEETDATQTPGTVANGVEQVTVLLAASPEGGKLFVRVQAQ